MLKSKAGRGVENPPSRTEDVAHLAVLIKEERKASERVLLFLNFAGKCLRSANFIYKSVLAFFGGV